ncbi:hypothetical protein LCGC14_1473480 [marine sediment metagenome]|uniref:Uncharacterized protein n=1 Tax=marine sediment metagenome TaxID=412755 RepID=A0A0F9JXL9_9ZZZZ
MGYSSTWSYGRSIQTNSDGTQLDPPSWSYGRSRFVHLMSGTIHELAGIVSAISSLTGHMAVIKALAGISQGISSLSGHLSVRRALAGVVNGVSSLTGTLTLLIRSSFSRSKIVEVARPGIGKIVSIVGPGISKVVSAISPGKPNIVGK